MTKALKKLGIEGIYFNIIKSIDDKPIANILLNGEKNETISSKVRNETRVTTFLTHNQYNFGIHSQSNKTGVRNKKD
jgi:hypothetical protein